MSSQTFLDDKVSTYILNSLRSNMSGQAWLVSGADVDYLNEFVEGWIDVMICLDRAEDGTPCGRCEACKRRQLGIYNCNSLKPLSLSRSILTDHIRQFIGKFAYKPLPWEVKIGIIYEADCMVEQAQNAFLKTLEEPPPQTCFFLISNKPDALLDTIRSRCRLLNLNRESFSYLNTTWFSELQEILQQTPLQLVERGGDLEFSGAITDYSVSVRSAQSGETNAQNRLTVTVKVDFLNNLDTKKNFEQSFSRFRDYDASLNLNAVEDALVSQINDELAQDIINKALVNW